MLGGGTNSSSFSVPEIGSEVFVEFPYQDIYSGFYSYYLQSAKTHQGFLDEDYPNSYGFRDSGGTQLKIDKAKQFLEFIHASGAQFYIDNTSTITLTSNTKIVFTSFDQKTQIVFDLATGEMSLSASDIYSTKSNVVSTVANTHNTNVGNHLDVVTGGRNSQIFGGYTRAVGGDDGESILGNKVSTVAGDKSVLVAGETAETYGEGKTEDIVLGDWTITAIAGDIRLTNTIGGALVISATGQVALGSNIAELLDLFDQTLSQMITVTQKLSLETPAGFGAPLIFFTDYAIANAQLTSIETLLGLIKGSL